MKKIIILLLCVCSVFAFVGCGESSTEMKTLARLENNQTLCVDGKKMMNYTDKNITTEYLVYEKRASYTLMRSMNSNTNSIKVGDYYYYWVSNIVNEELELGTKTTDITCEVYYLPYGNDAENIAVRHKITQNVTYGYEGGFKDMARIVDIDLNSYFESFDALKQQSKDLAALIDAETSKKYYVDVTTPTQVHYEEESYTNTYYYFE